MLLRRLPVVLSLVCLAGCGDDVENTDDDGIGFAGDCTTTVSPSDDDQTVVQTAFIEAQDGDSICLSRGTYVFTQELSIDVPNVTIRGEGMDHTILDFSAEEVGGGANGIKASSDGLTFEDLQVLDTPGDGIRVDDATDVTFRRVWTSWSEPESQGNGAYGMYPVGCTNVLIEDSKVNGARDAGIYVGQSNNILVQNNEVWGNVAGIEIENSNNAEVRGNHAHDNTAGILVFNLPGLRQNGAGTLVHNNLIENNNLPNFGIEGTVVAVVPGGSGIIVLACDDNEFRDNIIRNNDTLGMVVFTYLPFLFGNFDDDTFDVSATGNWIHDNTWENNGSAPFGALHNAMPDRVKTTPSPDILFDGCAVQPEGATGPVNCVQDDGARFQFLDICNDYANPSTDAAAFDCAITPIAEQP